MHGGCITFLQCVIFGRAAVKWHHAYVCRTSKSIVQAHVLRQRTYYFENYSGSKTSLVIYPHWQLSRGSYLFTSLRDQEPVCNSLWKVEGKNNRRSQGYEKRLVRIYSLWDVASSYSLPISKKSHLPVQYVAMKVDKSCTLTSGSF